MHSSSWYQCLLSVLLFDMFLPSSSSQFCNEGDSNTAPALYLLMLMREGRWIAVTVGIGQFLSLAHMHVYRHPMINHPCVTCHHCGGLQCSISVILALVVNKPVMILSKIKLENFRRKKRV